MYKLDSTFCIKYEWIENELTNQFSTLLKVVLSCLILFGFVVCEISAWIVVAWWPNKTGSGRVLLSKENRLRLFTLRKEKGAFYQLTNREPGRRIVYSTSLLLGEYQESYDMLRKEYHDMDHQEAIYSNLETFCYGKLFVMEIDFFSFFHTKSALGSVLSPLTQDLFLLLWPSKSLIAWMWLAIFLLK